MGEVARAAGCSRATLYRYFSDRRELQLAYVHREARRIGAAVTRETAGVEGREARLVAAVLSALRQVRGTPLLAGWFGADGTAVTAYIVSSSEVLETLGLGFVEDPLARVAAAGDRLDAADARRRRRGGAACSSGSWADAAGGSDDLSLF